MNLAWFVEEACKLAKMPLSKWCELSREEAIKVLEHWHSTISPNTDKGWVPPSLDHYIKAANFKTVIKNDEQPSPLEVLRAENILLRQTLDALEKKMMSKSGHQCTLLGPCDGIQCKWPITGKR